MEDAARKRGVFFCGGPFVGWEGPVVRPKWVPKNSVASITNRGDRRSYDSVYMKHPPKPTGTQRGFTLIELMMTLVIAIILMAVGIPQFRNMTASSRLSSQTMDIIGAVSMARSEAIRRNAAVTLCRVAAVADTTCAGATAPSWGFWIIRTAGGTIIKRDTINTFGSTIKVASSFTGDAITFGSDGLARNGTLASGTPLSPTPGIATNFFTICTTRPQNSNNNFRKAALGGGSRVTTTKYNSTC
jgi:type IV fimbrial biogenesis protein FimT